MYRPGCFLSGIPTFSHRESGGEDLNLGCCAWITAGNMKIKEQTSLYISFILGWEYELKRTRFEYNYIETISSGFNN